MDATGYDSICVLYHDHRWRLVRCFVPLMRRGGRMVPFAIAGQRARRDTDRMYITSIGRRRASTARSYLQPALKRPNLQVVTGALVQRVLFDGTRAVGVEYSRNETTERVDVAGEVILAAGAIGSPHILQLSGVGDPNRSEAAGGAAGVGE